ncbi:DNA-binding response regulator [Cellulomonas sp. C5510]|uniref:response regulator transcription factor n=1 Tax=Cellulomonas sp. C5510 TaxID=2871170 RepID=UPI001C987FAE|nr:response regulator transcription factor [Cellulomonas sp. C5510]QZN84676.1 response regulator transcription factor [Cellulomonas sp. C5510]
MIRVLLADDETLLRTALASLLELEGDIAVVAQCDDGPSVLAESARHAVDVFLLDLEMPGASGLETAAELLAADPGRRVVVVTRHARPGVLRTALETGVRGFVPKSVAAGELAAIIRRVHVGGRHVDPVVAFDAMQSDCPLTDRELDVLRLTQEGRSIAAMAGELHLAPGTVRNYLSNAITRLGERNRHDAARHARRQGWI